MIQRIQVPLLWTLLGLFTLRVLGQIYVGVYAPPWLPPWPEWYSGLLAYPVLLPTQIGLLMWMSVVSVDNSRKSGRFYVQSDRVKDRLRVFSLVYFLVMVARYIIVMSMKPEMRWLHGTLPILFHFVLAAYIFVLTQDSAVLRTREAPYQGDT